MKTNLEHIAMLACSGLVSLLVSFNVLRFHDEVRGANESVKPQNFSNIDDQVCKYCGVSLLANCEPCCVHR